LIFDPQQSAFVWANSAGLMLLGVKSLARLAQDRLDRALPAAARLIAFANDEQGGLKHMALELWTPRGPVHLEAIVEHLVLSRDKTGVLIRSGGVALDRRKAEAIIDGVELPSTYAPELLVIEATPAASPGLAPVISPHCRQSVELSHEDRETLREIARLIREGELVELPSHGHSSAADRVNMGMADVSEEKAPTGQAGVSKPGEVNAPPALQFDNDPMRLLAEVSHELRTPLTAIRGYAELIAAKPGDLRVADRARHIIDAADHVLALIGDILDAREIARGQADLVFTDVDLAHELAQAAAMVRPQAAKAGVALVSAPVSGLPKVVADARRVRQVIVNLAGNAIKFTAAGGSVRLDAAYAADGGVVVTVSDTGRGMAPAEMETLLGAGASEQRPASRGIGLPLSRALAEANGARLSIESRSGLGTVARLSFPASSVVPP
jgi:signal transduction histidine kinase